MYVYVLGSAAGGGYPQWNCNCPNCKGLRQATIKSQARTQSSIMVSANKRDWVIINASPDILIQIQRCPYLQPARYTRDTGIKGIVLSDSQVDHTTGLMMLREGDPLNVYCSDPVNDDLNHGYPLFRILEHYCKVVRHRIITEPSPMPFEVDGIQGIELHPIPLESKAPPYSPHRLKPVNGSNLGFKIINKAHNKSMVYAPGIGTMTDDLIRIMKNTDLLLIDGTCWDDDELISLGINSKRALDMGHLALNGPHNMLAQIKKINAKRSILIHINNTNPILNEESTEHRMLLKNQIEMATDTMLLEL